MALLTVIGAGAGGEASADVVALATASTTAALDRLDAAALALVTGLA